MSLEKYLSTRYVRGGRGPNEYDCYGMIRDARVELYGCRLLPLCADAEPGKLSIITRTVNRVAHDFKMIGADPAPGHVAAGWHGKVCVHVGLVVAANGGLRILETDAATGPCLTRLTQFEDRFSKVVYYAD